MTKLYTRMQITKFSDDQIIALLEMLDKMGWELLAAQGTECLIFQYTIRECEFCRLPEDNCSHPSPSFPEGIVEKLATLSAEEAYHLLLEEVVSVARKMKAEFVNYSNQKYLPELRAALYKIDHFIDRHDIQGE